MYIQKNFAKKHSHRYFVDLNDDAAVCFFLLLPPLDLSRLGRGLRPRARKTRVLSVFNKHYGEYESLPFDLRHKGRAVVFDLAPEART